MKPVKFEEQNTTYVAEGCGDLPAHKAEHQIISCWELTEEEKKEVQKTGVVWLSVFGQQQPPVWLGIETPFIREEGERNMKDKDIRKNGSGCNDPTAYAAITKVTKDGKPKNRNRQKDVFDAMHIIKSFLDLIDFEVVGHITLKDKQTGRRYE